MKKSNVEDPVDVKSWAFCVAILVPRMFKVSAPFLRKLVAFPDVLKDWELISQPVKSYYEKSDRSYIYLFFKIQFLIKNCKL